jgi:hypothetical protein
LFYKKLRAFVSLCLCVSTPFRLCFNPFASLCQENVQKVGDFLLI